LLRDAQGRASSPLGAALDFVAKQERARDRGQSSDLEVASERGSDDA
jgi:hypothetical protein